MKVCIICSQILGKEKIGGFGSMTRQLAETLAAKGIEVTVLVPKKYLGKEIEQVPTSYTLIGLTLRQMVSLDTYRKMNADVYHSQNPTIMSLMAQRAEPSKKHIITCRDPRDFNDWINEFMHSTWTRRIKIPLSYFFEEGPLITAAVRNADVVGCPAEFLRAKAKKLYRLSKLPVFLPNIEQMPTQTPEKAKQPTVCVIGRLDKRKRPELVFALAQKFPEVNFLIVGQAEEPRRHQQLLDQASKIPNISMLGYLDKFDSHKLYDVYNKSWILLNTASREGLPLTFIEAASRGCAILSSVNPDGFASSFGYWAKHNDFEKGLSYLLKDNNWRNHASWAFRYAQAKYNPSLAVQTHLNMYRSTTVKSHDTSETIASQFPEPCKVSAVIVNYNGSQYLPDLLESLARQTHPVDEIIVVDNCSSDDSIKYIVTNHPQVRLVKMASNNGPGAARNWGYVHAKNDFILQLDNDTILHHEALSTLLHASITSPQHTFFVPLVLYAQNKDVIQKEGCDIHYLGITINTKNHNIPKSQAQKIDLDLKAFTGVCYLVKRDPAIVPYDKAYFYMLEDLDYSVRNLLLGHSALLVPEAEIYHKSGTPGLSFRSGSTYPDLRLFYLIRNRLIFILKNYSLLSLITIVPPSFIYDFFLCIFSMLKTRHKLTIFRSYASLILQLPWILAKRETIQNTRRFDDSKFLDARPFHLNQATMSMIGNNRLFKYLDKCFEFYGKYIMRL